MTSEPVQCVTGCASSQCCAISNQGVDYHRCLSQLNKKLGRDSESVKNCGSCNKHLEEGNGNRGTVASS